MKFGIFYELQLPRPWKEGDEYRLYQNALSQVEFADKLGYDYAWEVEHHFLEEYSHSPSPESFLAAASQRTKNIRLGHGIYQVTTNHPARVAERVACLDLLSGGRCEFQGATSYGLSVFPVGNYDAARKLELMGRYQPKALLGTTSYFGHLAAVSSQDPSSLGLKVLMTGGEGSGFAWLERLEDSWGARVFDRYGCTQAGNDHMFCCEIGIGTVARPGMMHNIDPMVLTEVIDPATGHHVKDGEAGEIIITSLYHTDTPLIRCRTRDRGIWHEHRYCSCGRPFAGVEVASISRLDDMKKVKGVNIWPQAVDDALFADADVDEYQVVLVSDDQEADVATIRVMPKKLRPQEDEQRWQHQLGEHLQRRIGIRFRLEVVAPGSLARSEYKAKRWLDERVHAR